MARIPNRWYDGSEGDGYVFHIKDKDLIRTVIADPQPISIRQKLALLNDIVIRKAWMEKTQPGEVDPDNYGLLVRLKEDYLKWLADNKIKVPTFIGVNFEDKLDWILTLFRQDSAYFERMGGIITFMLINSEPRYQCVKEGILDSEMQVTRNVWTNNKKDRLEGLQMTRKWWSDWDLRDRTKVMIGTIFDYLIYEYQHVEFFTRSIDFMIDWMLEHKKEWKVVTMYDPRQWYARGKGQINYLVHGRMG